MKRSPFTRLSDSSLWDLQRKAYSQFGVKSWTERGVPFQITNNSLIAKQYAKVAFPLFKKGPVTFLELGAGSGRFAYLFLLELLKLGVPEASICYLLTDFSEKNVAFWKNHPRFKVWIDRGVVLPLLYDPLKGEALEKKPQFVIANYFFDAIPQDLYRVEKGRLLEGLVSFCMDKEYDLEDLSGIPHVSLEYSFQEVDRKPDFHFKLDQEKTFLFPSKALVVIEKLFSICQSPFILLAADREFSDFKIHGTFSFPVGFHFIDQFFVQKGGEAHLFKNSSVDFTVGLFSSQKLSPEMSRCFQEEQFGGIDFKLLNHKDFISSLIKVNWDPTYFFFHLDVLEKLLLKASSKEKALFKEGASLVESHFYPLVKEEMFLLDRLEPFLKTDATSKLFADWEPLGSESTLLQIGEMVLDFFPLITNRTVISSDLTSLQKVGLFDLIAFTPEFVERPPSPTLSPLFSEIEEIFPNLDKIVYTDEHLEDFLRQIKEDPSINPNHLVRFFLSLEKKGQITHLQLQNVFRSLKIALPERQDFFEILLAALKHHLKKGGIFKGVFPDTFKEARFLNEIVANLYFDYKEEEYSHVKGEGFLLVTIEKLG
jgi:hypothetical protein